MRVKFAPRRWKGLSEKWEKSGYCSRDPSHPHASLNLRLHRSLTWVKRAEDERKDYDASFVFYWIAFNAAYGQQDSPATDHDKEEKLFCKYLRRVVAHDWNAIQKIIWPHLESPIRSLMDNEHVFQPSWDSQDQGLGNQNWTTMFDKSKRQMKTALHQRTLALWQNTSSPDESPLCELFRRIYTLRNQLLHGGATYRGRVNRRQVEDGAQIMAWLMPCFIEVMIDHPKAGWGLPRYPVRPDRFPHRLNSSDP